MTGKLVLSENRSSPDSRISISTKDFENGVYVIKITGFRRRSYLENNS